MNTRNTPTKTDIDSHKWNVYRFFASLLPAQLLTFKQSQSCESNCKQANQNETEARLEKSLQACKYLHNYDTWLRCAPNSPTNKNKMRESKCIQQRLAIAAAKTAIISTSKKSLTKYPHQPTHIVQTLNSTDIQSPVVFDFRAMPLNGAPHRTITAKGRLVFTSCVLADRFV